MSTITEKLISTIDFAPDSWEYGMHDGFFNFVVWLDGEMYHVQCCAGDDKVDIDDCGHNDGICGDVNEKLITAIQNEDDDYYDCVVIVLDVISAAYQEYLRRESVGFIEI